MARMNGSMSGVIAEMHLLLAMPPDAQTRLKGIAHEICEGNINDYETNELVQAKDLLVALSSKLRMDTDEHVSSATAMVLKALNRGW